MRDARDGGANEAAQAGALEPGTPGKRSRAEQLAPRPAAALPSSGPIDEVAAQARDATLRDLTDEVFGLHRGDDLAGRKTAKPAPAETAASAGTLPVATMVVEVYDASGRLVGKKSVPVQEDPFGEGGYQAQRTQGGGWAWDAGGGQDARVDVQFDDHGNLTNPGRTVEQWVGTLPRHRRATRIVIRVLSEQSAGAGGGAGAGEEGEGTGAAAARSGPITLGKMPDQLEGTAAPEPAPATGSGRGVDGGGGTSIQDATRRGAHRQGDESGIDGGSPRSDGTSATATDEGSSAGHRDGPSHDDDTPEGRFDGRRGGKAGAAVRTERGRASGRPDGEGTDASLTHNERAERAPGVSGNIPEDGGQRGGLPGGQVGKGVGGVPDAGAWWQVISVPSDLAPLIALGQIILAADVSGVADKLVTKAIAGMTKRALKDAAKAEIEHLVEHEMRSVEQHLAQERAWTALSAPEQEAKRATLRAELARVTHREALDELDTRVKALEAGVATLEATRPAHGLGEALVGNARSVVERELDATRTVREALAGLEPPRAGKDPPYHPRTTRDALDEAYPGASTPGTVARDHHKNAKLAGQRHPRTGIVFDERGFPIFDDVAAFDTRLPAAAVGAAQRRAHFIAATTQVDEAIARGELSAARFHREQLDAIRAHKPQIPGYTWHHHQEVGRMQLIPLDLHKSTGHIGGFESWYP